MQSIPDVLPEILHLELYQIALQKNCIIVENFCFAIGANRAIQLLGMKFPAIESIRVTELVIISHEREWPLQIRRYSLQLYHSCVFLHM